MNYIDVCIYNDRVWSTDEEIYDMFEKAIEYSRDNGL